MTEVAVPASSLGKRPAWLVRRAAPVVVLRALGALLGLLFWVVLSRLLGASGAGILRQGIAAMMLVAVLLRFGLDSILLRETAVLVGAGHLQTARSLVRRCLGLCLRVGLFVSAGALVAAFILDRSGSSPLPEVVLILIAAALPMALLTLAGEAEKGAGHAVWGTLLQFNIRNLIYLPLVLIVVGGGSLALARDPEAAVRMSALLLAGAILVAAVMGSASWMRGAGAAESVDLKPQLRSAFPLYQCALFGVGLEWLDTLALGAFAESAEVGVYGAAVSAALVMSFLLYAANAIMAPRFARAFRSNESERLASEARAATRLMGIVALPTAGALFLLAEPLMGLFGDGFVAAVPAFRVLLFGHVLNMATGPVGFLLLMGHRERAFRNNVAIAALVDLVLLVALTPSFGIIGAAWATAIAMGVVNLLHLFACRREFGFSTLGPDPNPAS